MALFENDTPTTEEPSIESFKLGDQEYSKAELEELVNFGKLAKEADEKYNTKIDRVYPEFTKKSQQLKEYEGKLSEYENKIKEYESKVSKSMPELGAEDEIRQAKEAARKLGLLTKEDIEELGLITKDKFGTQYKEVRQAEKLIETMESYAKETDGSDGRPKFDVDEILNYMQDTGIQDFKVAYKVKYDDKLTAWKDQQLSKAKKPGMYTESSSNAGMTRLPRIEKVTRDNLKDAVGQALLGEL